MPYFYFYFIFTKDMHEGIYGQGGSPSVGSGRRSYSHQGLIFIYFQFITYFFFSEISVLFFCVFKRESNLALLRLPSGFFLQKPKLSRFVKQKVLCYLVKNLPS